MTSWKATTRPPEIAAVTAVQDAAEWIGSSCCSESSLGVPWPDR